MTADRRASAQADGLPSGQDILAAMRARRAFPPGRRRTCPSCSRRTFLGRDDLRVEVVVGATLLLFRHLHGAKCTSCAAQSLEPYEQADLEEEVANRFTPDYEARVSNVGKGTVGTYWPKDVQRLLRLRKGTTLRLQVLSEDTMVVKVE